MSCEQTEIILKPRNRGFHLITDEVVRALPQLADYSAAILHLFIQHTSASLTINENADPTVRADFSSHFDRFVPEKAPYYRHTLEGSDDMPAHIKSSLLGVSISIPVTDGHLALGTWQGIYLGEHRDFGGQRRLIATLMGERMPS
ncbi:MAG: YjbQ family protein [Gammaproteobacteria bacterium]|nr:MAG: YjbQ family protein [Gammaproteobacteria bacterium]